jgi:hypothetical protein
MAGIERPATDIDRPGSPTQAGRQPLHTKCLTDLGRSKAQEPDRLCVARLGDPPNHVHGRGSQPPDTPRRSRGRERDHAALRYTLPAPRSQTHLQETPNRQGRHRRRHQERLTRAWKWLGLRKERPGPESSSQLLVSPLPGVCGRKNVNNSKTFHSVGVIERKPIGNTTAAIMPSK